MKVLLLLLFAFSTWTASAALIYLPPNFKPETAKVVVVIHGCLQSAEVMALATGWDRIADRENLAIYYPQVPADSDSNDCWGWFWPKNQKAESGSSALS